MELLISKTADFVGILILILIGGASLTSVGCTVVREWWKQKQNFIQSLSGPEDDQAKETL